MEKSTVTAVHDDDLIGFLKSMGLLSDVQAGRTRCRFCQGVITLENLNAIFPDSGTIRVSCDLPACVKMLMHHISTRQQP